MLTIPIGPAHPCSQQELKLRTREVATIVSQRNEQAKQVSGYAA